MVTWRREPLCYYAAMPLCYYAAMPLRSTLKKVHVDTPFHEAPLLCHHLSQEGAEQKARTSRAELNKRAERQPAGISRVV